MCYERKGNVKMLKKISTTAFVLTVLLVLAWQIDTVEASVIEDGLVLYWSFEGATIAGDTVEDIVGDNDGTLIGGPGVVEGKFGDGLEFDGSDDYAQMSEIPLGDFTIEAWFQATNTPGTWCRIFDAGVGAGGDVFITPNHGRTGGDLGFSIETGAEFGSGVRIAVGDWYHMAATYDKGGAGMALYVNGELKGTSVYNLNSFEDWASPQNWYLAKANWGDPLFPGIIDEFRIYDRALSQDEVDANMNASGLAVAPVQKLTSTWGAIKVSE